jgi:hypothetical protein
MLSSKVYFQEAIDFNTRGIAWYDLDMMNGVSVEYTRSTSEFCIFVFSTGENVFSTCVPVDSSEWFGWDQQWHEVSISIIGDTLDVQRDGKSDLVWIDTRLDAFPREGSIMLTVNGNISCFDAVALASVSFPDYVCGDADASDGVDIDDIVYLITFIFGGGPTPSPYESGDADCSGEIDIDDVVYLINYVFASGPAPCAGCR